MAVDTIGGFPFAYLSRSRRICTRCTKENQKVRVNETSARARRDGIEGRE
jgi:hypothetical protein